MGAYGCVWVRWGAQGTGDTKTRQSWGIWGVAGLDFGPMAGEISPDMMFWKGRPKWRNMGAKGCKWVRIGGLRCIINNGGKNKPKKTINGREGHGFA